MSITDTHTHIYGNSREERTLRANCWTPSSHFSFLGSRTRLYVGSSSSYCSYLQQQQQQQLLVVVVVAGTCARSSKFIINDRLLWACDAHRFCNKSRTQLRWDGIVWLSSCWRIISTHQMKIKKNNPPLSPPNLNWCVCVCVSLLALRWLRRCRD